jgi:hypothetical protein
LMPTSTSTNKPFFGMSYVNYNLIRKETNNLPIGFFLMLILCISLSIAVYENLYLFCS